MNSQCNINEATYIDVSSKDLFPFGINLISISISVDDYHVTIQCAMAYADRSGRSAASPGQVPGQEEF